MCICVHLFVFVYICLYLCILVCICVHVFVFVYICLYLFVFVYHCFYLCIFVFLPPVPTNLCSAASSGTPFSPTDISYFQFTTYFNEAYFYDFLSIFNISCNTHMISPWTRTWRSQISGTCCQRTVSLKGGGRDGSAENMKKSIKVGNVTEILKGKTLSKNGSLKANGIDGFVTNILFRDLKC